MKFRGRVEAGVVVLDRGGSLREGTLVEIEPLEIGVVGPVKGSAEALLRTAGAWEMEQAEVDRLLRDLREMKQAELKSQIDSDNRTVLQ